MHAFSANLENIVRCHQLIVLIAYKSAKDEGLVLKDLATVRSGSLAADKSSHGVVGAIQGVCPFLPLDLSLRGQLVDIYLLIRGSQILSCARLIYLDLVQ